MSGLAIVLVVVLVLVLIAVLAGVRIVKQYELGVLFRLGRVLGTKKPGLRVIIPFVDVLPRISLRIVTMPIQSQGIITRDNVSVDVSAVAYFRVVDAVKSVVAIENVRAAIDQIAQTTLRKVVGQHTLDETLSETCEQSTAGSEGSGWRLRDRVFTTVLRQRTDTPARHRQATRHLLPGSIA
jgi:regulator of protease activity HflC (stomatin/prohibitin superfamily)